MNKRKRGTPTACFFVFVAIMMITAMTSSRKISVTATPVLDDEYGIGDVSGTATSSFGEIETIQAKGASSSVDASFTSPTANDCTDDPDFLYKEKEACKWVARKKRKLKKRCKRVYLGATIAKRCRETCDYNNCAQKKLALVGAYYYPWWGDDFHRGVKPDVPNLYLRRQLINPQEFPALGEYDDTQPDVIAQHLKWSRQHNIKLWVTSWWGEGRREDDTIKNHILTNKQLKDHKIAIFYETTGRIRKKYGYKLDNVVPDLEYLCKTYFTHSNYYRILDNGNGISRPVFFVYLTRKLEELGLLEEVISLMREGAKAGGCDDIFIVGDQVFQGPPLQNNAADLIPFEILDAVTNYDVYGSIRGYDVGGYVGGRQNVTDYYQGEQRAWKEIARSKGCAFIPCASPGFNDRGVRPEVKRIPLSRRLSPGAPEGSLFRAALQEGLTLVDSEVDNLIMVNSFNEWHEDTQIEPAVAFNGSKGNNSRTNLPTDVTYGLEYEAYGALYLKILKKETVNWDVSMAVAPSSASQLRISPHESGCELEVITISDTIGLELD